MHYKDKEYTALNDAKNNCFYQITEIRNRFLALKLMEMGCVPGEKIKVDMIAPFKDPISISVAGYQLSLRLNEAEHIFVEEI